MPRLSLSEKLAKAVRKEIDSGRATSQSIAEHAGCTRQYLRLITTGQRTPTLDLASRIAAATGNELTIQTKPSKKKRKPGKS